MGPTLKNMKPDPAIDIIRELRGRGHEAYLVGGCVRDMVMGIEPADYDIATSAKPEEIVKIFPRTESIGAQFGVILVIYRGHPFEVNCMLKILSDHFHGHDLTNRLQT